MFVCIPICLFLTTTLKYVMFTLNRFEESLQKIQGQVSLSVSDQDERSTAKLLL